MAGSKTSEAQRLSETRVVVLGQGYVGLPVAIRAVEVGYDVIGLDLDVSKIEGLAAGKTHIDDISDSDVKTALATGRYQPTAQARDIAGFDIAVVTVPTPLKDGVPDMRHIESAGTMIARFLRPGATVILESTTYPGTTEDFFGPILEATSGLTAGLDFHLGFSPERIDPGNQTWNFQTTPKVVSGMDDASLKAIQSFYDLLVDETVATKGTKEAELTKLLENTFRHVNIALVNELAINSRELGIDFWDVIDAAKTKPFGFMPFYPGPGVGGHCLPIDPTYLSWQFERELGTVSEFVKIANAINNGMPAHVVRRVQGGLNDLKKSVNGSRILVLGVAYKKNSNDARETPATPLIEQLVKLGADVRVYDKWIGAYELDSVITRVQTLTKKELQAADATVIVTDHDDVNYKLVCDHAKYVLDTRRKISGRNVAHL
jgi:UDP-N-acetyl-D-glucosamine dehydrogenase